MKEIGSYLVSSVITSWSNYFFLGKRDFSFNLEGEVASFFVSSVNYFFLSVFD